MNLISYNYSLHHVINLLISLQLVHKRLASQCLGLLIDVEEQSFEKRLDTFLPLLSSCLVTTSTTDCTSRLPEQSDNESWSVVSEDHLLYNTLSTLKKIFNTCMVAMETSDHTLIILSKCVMTVSMPHH